MSSRERIQTDCHVIMRLRCHHARLQCHHARLPCQTDRQTDIRTDKQIDRQTNRQADMSIGRYAGNRRSSYISHSSLPCHWMAPNTMIDTATGAMAASRSSEIVCTQTATMLFLEVTCMYAQITMHVGQGRERERERERETSLSVRWLCVRQSGQAGQSATHATYGAKLREGGTMATCRISPLSCATAISSCERIE